jgi:hypothetical protein
MAARCGYIELLEKMWDYAKKKTAAKTRAFKEGNFVV